MDPSQHETSSQKDRIQTRCKAQRYEPTQTPWETIRGDILAIERAHFGDNAFEEELFIKDFSNPNNTVVLLRDTETGRIVGFTYAEPLTNFAPEKWEEITPNDTYPNALSRDDNGLQTAYISDTALHPDYVGHHLVGVLIGGLEQELRNRTNVAYTRFERHSVVANKYASNVRESYADRLVYEKPIDSKYGPQVFFRINLVPELT